MLNKVSRRYYNSPSGPESNDMMPNSRKSTPLDSSTIFSDICEARLFPPRTAAVVQSACAMIPPSTTPNGFSSAAKPIVAI
jgi:hypothetical protein